MGHNFVRTYELGGNLTVRISYGVRESYVLLIERTFFQRTLFAFIRTFSVRFLFPAYVLSAYVLSTVRFYSVRIWYVTVRVLVRLDLDRIYHQLRPRQMRTRISTWINRKDDSTTVLDMLVDQLVVTVHRMLGG